VVPAAPLLVEPPLVPVPAPGVPVADVPVPLVPAGGMADGLAGDGVAPGVVGPTGGVAVEGVVVGVAVVGVDGEVALVGAPIGVAVLVGGGATLPIPVDEPRPAWANTTGGVAPVGARSAFGDGVQARPPSNRIAVNALRIVMQEIWPRKGDGEALPVRPGRSGLAMARGGSAHRARSSRAPTL
jgi:hypothetical protein